MSSSSCSAVGPPGWTQWAASAHTSAVGGKGMVRVPVRSPASPIPRSRITPLRVFIRMLAATLCPRCQGNVLASTHSWAARISSMRRLSRLSLNANRLAPGSSTQVRTPVAATSSPPSGADSWARVSRTSSAAYQSASRSQAGRSSISSMATRAPWRSCQCGHRCLARARTSLPWSASPRCVATLISSPFRRVDTAGKVSAGRPRLCHRGGPGGLGYVPAWEGYDPLTCDDATYPNTTKFLGGDTCLRASHRPWPALSAVKPAGVVYEGDSSLGG
ncbi:hypothetical protein BN12_4120006 [Nostocoides japonicum T1-X7]|uniref:Uncharacterized protein n=1 Tax=Nostocoides japonicum T1-X7 TaxID=1194083 RepID=A0A077LZE7_9MICO|nr:hypothetical protein BN12_4120006 [Tetrasphaera japonica T1-X7]